MAPAESLPRIVAPADSAPEVGGLRGSLADSDFSRPAEPSPQPAAIGAASQTGAARPDMTTVTADTVVGQLQIGTTGKIVGLVNAPYLNGVTGYVVAYDSTAKRYKIQCDNDQNVAIRPENFEVDMVAASAVGQQIELSAKRSGSTDSDFASPSAAASLASASGNNARNRATVETRVPMGGAGGGAGGQRDRRGMVARQKSWIDKTVPGELFPWTARLVCFGTLWLTVFTLIMVYGPR